MADDKGAKVVAIGTGCEHPPYKLMAPGSIKTIKDLKGKTISAASPIEPYTAVTRTILAKNGLDPEKDVNWIYGGGQNQRLAALMSGAVQAGLVTSPADALLSSRGYHALAFTPDYTEIPLSVTGARRDWAEQHPETVRSFLGAMAQAASWLNDRRNRTEALALLAKHLPNTTLADAAQAYDAWIVRAHVFPNNYCSARADLKSILGLLHEAKRTQSTPDDADRYADEQWCRR